jgi:mono/diheme cytochrome c family protein
LILYSSVHDNWKYSCWNERYSIAKELAMKKIMKRLGIVLGWLFGLSLLAGLILYPIGMKKFTRVYSDIKVKSINIPTDAEAVIRGKHIATIWGCTKCHGDDLSGKFYVDNLFLGRIPASNLTSGEGGIAQAYTDIDWVRAIRHGVMPNGQGEILMYNYSMMSDQDLGDLIAYLKQIPPVNTSYPPIWYGLFIPIAPEVGVSVFTPAAEKMDHDAPPQVGPELGATVEYGKYLSTICFQCHSARFGSKLVGWTQEDFKRAVQSGMLPNGEQISRAMPPKIFGALTDTELTALWLYLTTSQP